MGIAENNKTVYVGLSGGVDSSVSAGLLKEQGYNVVGVFMKNWSGDDFGIQAECPWEEDQKAAEAAAKHLGIEFRSFNFEKEYRAKVVEYFFAEYEKGRTPNPDVMCNKEIKFKLFLEKALEMGADYIATGHYARKLESSLVKDIEGVSKAGMFKGIDENKDQSYFLYNLSSEQLSRVLFPIGEMTKPEVREYAKRIVLPNADRPDSQGICFIGEINVLKFLMSRIPEKIGDIIDIDSNQKVGEHKGVFFYTIGQRDGLGIGGQEVPYFVVDKDVIKNVVYVGHGNNHPAMLKSTVEIESLHLINKVDLTKLQKLEGLSASIRYRNKPHLGKLVERNSKFEFHFDEPVRASSSGQSLVIYYGDECIGGGIIA